MTLSGGSAPRGTDSFGIPPRRFRFPPAAPSVGDGRSRGPWAVGPFTGKARYATCHVLPLFTEPDWPMHTGTEIGIDAFQSSHSSEKRYRTPPLRGLFARAKEGGFYHDGRFPDLQSVVEHSAGVFHPHLTSEEPADLVEYLKSP